MKIYVMIPTELIRRKRRIEREFTRLHTDAMLNIVLHLPEHLEINISKGNIWKSKLIHYNEISHVRDTIKLHGW